MCSAQKTPAFVRACRFACAATRRAGPCAPARRPKPKKGGASGTIGAPGGKKAGPARGARAQTARAPFCFGLPHRHHHAFCRLTAAGAAVAPQKGRRARPVRALPPAPGPGPQPEKRTQQKPPAPGDGGWGFFFRQAGARLLCFPLCAVLHKKAKPTLPSAPNQNLPLWQVGALPWVSCSLLPQRREVCNPSTDTGLPMIG